MEETAAALTVWSKTLQAITAERKTLLYKVPPRSVNGAGAPLKLGGGMDYNGEKIAFEVYFLKVLVEGISPLAIILPLIFIIPVEGVQTPPMAWANELVELFGPVYELPTK